MKRTLAIATILLCGAVTPSHATSFTLQHNGTPAAAQTAIAHAADIWSSILISPVPVKVTVNWVSLAGLALGITLPNGERDFTGAPQSDTWYPTALANSIAGIELNSGEADFNIWLDSGTNWYTGTDGNTPVGQYDLVGIALHEMGHGLGIVGLAKKSGAIGSFGTLTAADFAPLVTDFPWPQLDTLPSVFDRHLSDGDATFYAALPDPSTSLGSGLTSGDVWFIGMQSFIANGGSDVRVYAPTTFALGSSCVHLDEATYPAGNANELMTPFANAGSANHWPGPVAIGILQDIGWTIAPNLGVQEEAQTVSLTLFPNPGIDHVVIGDGSAPINTVRVIDANGAIVPTNPCAGWIDISRLSPGLYQVIANDGVPERSARFMKQ